MTDKQVNKSLNRDLVYLILSAKGENEGLQSLFDKMLGGLEIAAKKRKQFCLMANAKMAYDKNEFLQQLPDELMNDTPALLGKLDDYRKDIYWEQRKRLSLSYLVEQLWMGKRLSDERYKTIALDAGSTEYCGRNPMLKDIPEEILREDFALIRYLHEHRGGMTIIKGKKHNSLGYLVQALVNGNKLSKERGKRIRFLATAADYVMKNEEMVIGEMGEAYSGLSDKQRKSPIMIRYLRKNMDRDKFTLLVDNSKAVSSRYFTDITKVAMELYGSNIKRESEITRQNI